jgi:hypothetical protein
MAAANDYADGFGLKMLKQGLSNLLGQAFLHL